MRGMVMVLVMIIVRKQNVLGWFAVSVAFLKTGKIAITQLRCQWGWKGRFQSRQIDTPRKKKTHRNTTLSNNSDI